MPIEEMVRIEDKVDLSNCPIPNRSYKIPRALLPSLEKFIVEMKNAGWIEDSTSEFLRFGADTVEKRALPPGTLVLELACLAPD